MRRKSDRNKSKSTPEKSPEKPSRRSHRHSRRRRKSSSSSSDDEPRVRSTSRVKTDSTSDKTGSRSVTPDSKPTVGENPEPQVKPDLVPEADVVKNDTDIKCESGIPDGAKPKDAPLGSGEWKEDNNFWQTDEKNDDHSGAAAASVAPEEKTKDSKDAGEVWKVQSANGSTGKGGEIQKLKICRQRLAESPELPKETPPRRRLSRTPKDSSGSSKNVDDNDDNPAAEEANKNVEQETLSSSSPSPPVHEALNVICETESPTKIKIINVGNLTPDKNHTPPMSSAEMPDLNIEEPKPADTKKPIQTKEEETINSTEEEKSVKASKPMEESESPEKSKAGEETTVTEESKTTDKVLSENVNEREQKIENDDAGNKSKQGSVEKSPSPKQRSVEKSPSPLPESTKQETTLSTELLKKEESNENVEAENQEVENKPTLVSSEKEKPVRRSSSSKSQSNEKEERRSVKKSSSPSPRRERKRRDSSSSSSSSDDSSSSSDSDSSSHNRKKSNKSKRRDGTKSAVSTKSGKKATSDSEDDHRHQKKDVPPHEVQLDRTHSANSNKENLVTNAQPASAGDSGGAGTTDQGGAVVTRKRRWGASKTIRPVKKPVLSISTDSLKNLIPGAKPIPAEELQLSVEEEEGQLDDDEDEIVEVAQQAEKESTKKKEREREKEERRKEHKEKEKELERKKKYNERKDVKPEKPSASGPDNQKGSSSRKILLITDDARKLAHSPSPPRRRPSSVLFITNLVRPFTAQQLKNLLLRTGTIAENGFWIDKIKSKCYVEYTTEDAAVETRHALHGVRWPVNNPKTLVVEFASHDDMAVAQALSEETDPIPRKAEPLVIDRSVEGWIADQARLKAQGDRSNRRVMAAIREWDVGKPEHPDEIIEQDHRARERQREQERRMRKERSHRSMTPDISELPARKQRRKEEDAPVKLLDDLFKKTKTSPCIYWLPLTAEQIAVKEEMRRQHMAEHERRVAEMKKAEQARRERDRRNRK